jgi:hypothetical protein
LNFYEGVAKLSMLSLKKLIISMERMGVEYVLIAQTSLSPSRTVTLKFGEAKGYPTPTWQLKLKLFEDNYPDIAYYVITPRERFYGSKKATSVKNSRIQSRT